jgi:hypothetical protein
VAIDGTISTVVGGGKPTSGNGDGGLGTNATLSAPYGVAVDGIGNVIICDQGADRIRRVATNGIITTVAGNGSANGGGDGGPATQAGIDSPWHVAADAAGRIYITERLDPFAPSSEIMCGWSRLTGTSARSRATATTLWAERIPATRVMAGRQHRRNCLFRRALRSVRKALFM